MATTASDSGVAAAALFDMDGTLVDTEGLWMRSRAELADLHGIAWTDSDAEYFRGRSIPDSKPHPEPCLTAARRLGVPSHLCVAIEDTVVGARSAAAAAMAVLLVPSAPSLVADAGWEVRTSLTDITAVELLELQAVR